MLLGMHPVEKLPSFSLNVAGKSEQISRAEFVSEDAWAGQSASGSIIWVLFEVSLLLLITCALEKI